MTHLKYDANQGTVLKESHSHEDNIASHIKNVIAELGEDPQREGLKDTPKRVSQSLSFLTKGYRENVEEILNGAVFESNMDEMVIVKDIEVYSLCEHHLLPFFGQCHVAYIPKGKIMGLSKVGRIVEMYARRLQVQENLTMQIAKTIQEVTSSLGVGVVMVMILLSLQ